MIILKSYNVCIYIYINISIYLCFSLPGFLIVPSYLVRMNLPNQSSDKIQRPRQQRCRSVPNGSTAIKKNIWIVNWWFCLVVADITAQGGDHPDGSTAYVFHLAPRQIISSEVYTSAPRFYPKCINPYMGIGFCCPFPRLVVEMAILPFNRWDLVR